jgi:predicted nucleic acid-binding protein
VPSKQRGKASERRHPSRGSELRQRANARAAGLVATCGVIECEIGWATRSGAEFDLVRADREKGSEWLATHDEDWHRALDVQAVLWRTGRISAVGFPDLLIAAVAEREQVTI